MRLIGDNFKIQKKELNNLIAFEIFDILKEEDYEFNTNQKESIFSTVYSRKFKEFDQSLRYWIRCFKKEKVEFYYVNYKCLQKIFCKYWKYLELNKRKLNNIDCFQFYKYLNTIFIYDETINFREFPVLQNEYLSVNYKFITVQDIDKLDRRCLRWNKNNNNNFINEKTKEMFLKSLGLAFTYTWPKESYYKNITWEKDYNQIKNGDLLYITLNNSVLFEFFATPFGVLIWKEYKNKPNNITKILGCYEFDYNRNTSFI